MNLGRVVGNDGAQGVQGEKGDKGDQGIQGEKGDKGDQGIQGEKGDQGVQGEKGDAGINGTDGINGTNGADGVGITDVTINADNELVLSFSNGNVINLGNIKGSKGDKGDKGDSGLNGKDGVGIQNVDVSADGALTVTLTNGTVLNLGNIKGADGLGITKAEINTSGELVLTYSNGDVKNLGKVTGENGKDGANGADGLGIKSLTLSPDGELVVTMSDNSISNLGNIKGDKGDKGEQGQQGLQGSKGADGRGIAKMSFNSNGELIVEYTDNTRDNLGKISDSTSENIDVNFVYHYEDSGYEVMASDVGKGQKVLAIPRTYKGYPITGLGSISSPGFGKCYDLIQITIPSNIVMLNNASGGMFGYCSKLREEGIIFEGEFTTWKDVNTYNTNNNNDTKLYYKNTDGTYTFANYTSIEFGKGAEYALYFDDENELKKALLGKAYYVVAVPVKKTYDPNAENLYVCREKNGLACTYIKETKKG